MHNSLWPRGLQHTRLPCPPFPWACSNSCPLSQWFLPNNSSSVPSSPPALSLPQCQGLVLKSSRTASLSGPLVTFQAVLTEGCRRSLVGGYFHAFSESMRFLMIEKWYWKDLQVWEERGSEVLRTESSWGFDPTWAELYCDWLCVLEQAT